MIMTGNESIEDKQSVQNKVIHLRKFERRKNNWNRNRKRKRKRKREEEKEK